MFYLPLVLPYLLQLLCIVHIVRTGREYFWIYADFLIRNGMNAEALQVIERFAGVRKQLNSMGMIYDRAWANKMLGLRTLARQAHPG